MAYAQYCIHDLSHRRTDGVNKHFIITGHKTLADDFVACILSEEKHDFLAGHNIVQEYGRDVIHDEPYTPEKLELCVARCDRGKWHRAEYQGSHEGISVLYDFDFGRIFEAKDSEIRKFAYDVSFLVRTFTARIRGVETYQQKERLLADEFEQFERFEFIAKWIYYDDETKYHIIDI